MNELIGNGRVPARLLATVLLGATTLIGSLTLLPATAAAQSQGATRTYAIPAGSLGDALNRFAQQSGLQLNYDAALTQGRSTTGLTDRCPARGAVAAAGGNRAGGAGPWHRCADHRPCHHGQHDAGHAAYRGKGIHPTRCAST